jgi:hypothetical protein
MNTCIFCGAEAAVNLGTARASCNACHDFVFSDVETIHHHRQGRSFPFGWEW